MGRVPADFHARVWSLLRHCKGLVIGDPHDGHNRLNAALARADTTPGERGFALQVEQLLNRIADPAHRQLQIEALSALSRPDLWQDARHAQDWLELDTLCAAAVRLGWAQRCPPLPIPAEQQAAEDAQAWVAFCERPVHEVAALLAAAAEVTGAPTD